MDNVLDFRPDMRRSIENRLTTTKDTDNISSVN